MTTDNKKYVQLVEPSILISFISSLHYLMRPNTDSLLAMRKTTDANSEA